MATRVIDKFGVRAGPVTAAYPDGSLINESAPMANDGSPLDQDVGNDWEGTKQYLLQKTGTTPNGQPDSVTNPQIGKAIEQIAQEQANTGDSQIVGKIFPIDSNKSAEDGEALTGYANVRLIGGDFSELTQFPIVSKTTASRVFTGNLTNINLTVRPYSATIGADDVWLLDINYFSALFVNPKAFWTYHDSTTVDNPQLQAASDYSAVTKLPYILFDGEHAINAGVVIKTGTPSVLGYGGGLKVVAPTVGVPGFYFAGPESGYSQPDGVIVDGIRIDANFNKCVPIWMSHPRNCKVTNNDIRNKTESHGILLRAEDPAGGTVSGNVISGNTVQGDQTTSVNSNYNGIIIDGLVDFGGLSITDYWKANFTIPSPTVAVRDNVIEGNRVIGGYYGIALYGGIGNTISNNTVNSNIRNISLQNSCSQNIVTGNTLLAPDSSAVHVAWGSITNLITGNNIISTRGQNGQALLNNYIGSQANTFLGNNIFVSSAAEPQYMMYCGVKSDGTIFKDNTCSGSVTRAYAGIESSWDSSITNVGHAANGIPSIGEGWSDEPQRNVIFDGNMFINTRSDRSVFFISQIEDTSGSYANIGTTLVNNTIKNAVSSKFYIELFEQTSGELNTIDLTGLTTPITASADASFVFPRGRDHFNQVHGNTLLNNSTTTTVVPSDATVAFSDSISLVASATPVTYFPGGKDNQSIIVRMSSNSTIQHGSSFIRLKGEVDAVSTTANQHMGFTRQSGIWFETWRNF